MITNKLRILITGGGGQLAKCIRHEATGFDYELFFENRQELDISNAKSVHDAFERIEPNAVINTAAYTAVDLAEQEAGKAFAINETGVANLAEACKMHNAALVHISTDYVFDGNSSQPYLETDVTNPQTVYGKSKRAGEMALINSGIATYWILRTAWLYSDYGKNFYKTISHLAETRDELTVVDDQRGAPTQALDLARFILENIAHIAPHNADIYHFVNSGNATWYDFASEIVSKKNTKTRVLPVTSAHYPTAAKRPAYSVLDNSKIQQTFHFKIRNWREAMPD